MKEISSELFAASEVSVIDSIVITKENDISKVLAEWTSIDPEIAIHGDLISGQAVKLFINWSDNNGTIALHQGDYFTFVITDFFDYNFVQNVTDVNLTNNFGEVVATYSIYDNGSNEKEVKITFTDYVETHTQISGDFWSLLFVGKVTTTEDKTLEFIVNGNLVAEGDVTVKPPGTLTPKDTKVGYSLPSRSVNGYYIFEWLVYLNSSRNTENGFNTLENFSFEDIIPSDSPHVFLTDELRQNLGILSNDYVSEIGEYTGADSYSPENRYQVFLYHFNSTDDNIWYNFINWKSLTDGLTSVGIDGGGGLDVSGIDVDDKLFSANLGTLTRPVAIRYFTVSTIKIAESALGDKEVVSLFNNTLKASSGEDLSSSLTLYRFQSGGSAQGIIGDYSFSFTKVNEKGAFLPGAMFSLYISEDFSVGADRIVYSDGNGIVAFKNIPEGTYYFQETIAPLNYVLDGTIYKVELTRDGFDIYYGETYETKLSGNKIINHPQSQVQPVPVTLTGTKFLTGQILSAGMFNFTVKDSGGKVITTGTNDGTGKIIFGDFELDQTGVYVFSIEEVSGTYSGITYDLSKYIVTVTVTDDGSGTLKAEITYPSEGVIFNNSYNDEPEPCVRPCPCDATKTNCRTSIKGKKIWIDNNNALGRRPLSVEITLLRDGEVYKRQSIGSAGDGVFVFCCLPIWKNSTQKYIYKVDEPAVPEGYTKSIDGYEITNTLIP